MKCETFAVYFPVSPHSASGHRALLDWLDTVSIAGYLKVRGVPKPLKQSGGHLTHLKCWFLVYVCVFLIQLSAEYGRPRTKILRPITHVFFVENEETNGLGDLTLISENIS